MSEVNWGSVADWVSGLGTMSAGAIALYLARESTRIRLTGYCGTRIMVGGGVPKQDVVMISATNIGTRATIVNNISMSVGWPKRRYAVINMVRDAHSVGVPYQLGDGQEGHWGIQLDAQRTWLRELCDGFITSEWGVKTLRFRIHTNHGESLSLKPEKAMLDELRRLIAERQKSPPAAAT